MQVPSNLDTLCSSEVLPDGSYCVGDDVCFLEDQGACNVALSRVEFVPRGEHVSQ